MNKEFENNLYYICSMIEYIGRKTHNKVKDVLSYINKKDIKHELDVASVNHCLSFEQVSDEWIEKYKIKKYFFLDSSFPMIHLLSSHEEKNIALRISEFEGMDTARNMAGRVNWIWIDCFTKIPIKKHEYDELKYLGYRLCFVSPELEGRDQDIEIYKRHLENEGMIFDAICTKGYNIGRGE